MKPDRFERLVKQNWKYTLDAKHRHVAAQLLRAEHRATVRVVKKLRKANHRTGYYAACKDILDWLDRRGR